MEVLYWELLGTLGAGHFLPLRWGWLFWESLIKECQTNPPIYPSLLEICLAFRLVHKVVEMILKITNYLHYCCGKQAIEKQVLSTLPISFIFLLLPPAHPISDLRSPFTFCSNHDTTSCNTKLTFHTVGDWAPGPGCSKKGYKLRVRYESLKSKIIFIIFVYSLMIRWPKKNRENNPGKCFWSNEKETRVKL